MNKEEIKIQELKLENEQLKLKFVLEKENNKGSWMDKLWAFAPFIGMFYWFVYVFVR